MSVRNPKEHRYLQRRSRAAYLTTLISMGLLLFFLGLFAAVLSMASNYSNQLLQSFPLSLYLAEGMDENQRIDLESWLGEREFVQAVRFISREEASAEMERRTGEDVVVFLDGFNPYPDKFEVSLKSGMVQGKSLQLLREEFESQPYIEDVQYPFEQIRRVQQNIQPISVLMGIGGLLFLGISLYLIFGAIRLSIFAQRFTIRSMQLIGATHQFIRRPFLWNGLLRGFLAGLLGGLLLVLSLFGTQSYLSEMDLGSAIFFEPATRTWYIGILVGIVLLGALLGFAGSYFAVNRYLSRNLDELM